MKKSISSLILFYFMFETMGKFILLEFQAARKNLLVTTILSFMFLMLIFSSWFLAMTMLTITLQNWVGNWLTSISIMSVANLLIAIIVLLFIFKATKKLNLSYQAKNLIKEVYINLLRKRDLVA